MFTISKPRKVNHPRYRWIVTYKDASNVKKKYFTRKVDAETFYDEKQQDILNHGTKEESITKNERQAVISFRDFIASLPADVKAPTLSDAVENFVQHFDLRTKSRTVQDSVDRLIQLVQRKGCSVAHLRTLETRLEGFRQLYGDWLICDVSTELIEEYLSDLDLGALTVNHRRAALNQLFRQAEIDGAIASNPVTQTTKRKETKEEPGILKPLQVARLLENAPDEILPGLALGFFAGIRRAELTRLNWDEIDFEDKMIVIKSAKAKTASRRTIPMRDNLKQWLLPHRLHESSIMPSEMIWRTRLGAAMEASGIKTWPKNAPRHSFASYHLAHFKNAESLALEMGHQDTQMLHEHYKALVTERSAKSYWAISPVQDEAIANIA